jgi:hypothetical protein
MPSLNLPGHKAAADIIAWSQAKADMKAAAAKEIDLRLKLVERLFKGKPVGLHTVDLGRGFVLTCEIKESAKVDPDKAVEAQLKLAKLGELGQSVAKSIFRWTAELRIGKFKELSAAHRKIVSAAFETKPGTPSLELREPRG